MNFCLPPELTKVFLSALKSGTLEPIKLAEMTSAERHARFSEIIGEQYAQPVNAAFESKLILKNKQQGIINWAKTTGGLKPEAARDLASRVSRMDQEILDPTNEQRFLEDLASKKLGTDVTLEEARTIASLSKAIEEARAALARGGDRLAYGRAQVAFSKYVNGLKEDANKLSVATFKNAPIKSAIRGVSALAGQTKSITASLDNSAIFNQGWRTLWTNPILWKRNAAQTFIDMARSFGGKAVLDEVQADIVSRPNYNLMKKAKLAVGTLEEQFPASISEKVPIMGRLYKASEAAYTGFVHRMRADVFDKYVEIARQTGVPLSNEELKSVGAMVNSLTGRGSLGKFEGSAANVANNILFSPRYLKSQFDFFTHPITGAGGSNFVRRRAAINILNVITGTAAILVLAKALNPDSVDFDPRSTDFGKIKVGATRFDVTGGLGAIPRLAARLITLKSKSSTGKITQLNSGKYGAPTAQDLVFDFILNKASPPAAVVRDLLRGEDFDHKKPTVLSSLNTLFVPFPVKTGIETWKNPKAANFLLTMLASFVGINPNTYAK